MERQAAALVTGGDGFAVRFNGEVVGGDGATSLAVIHAAGLGPSRGACHRCD